MKKFILTIIIAVITILNYNYTPEKQIKISNDYLMIEKINLNQEILSYKTNSVDDGIIYLKDSNFENDFYILAAHSGNSKIAYFKNLYKLSKNDEIILNINNKQMIFKVEDKYYIKKTGSMKIPANMKNTLYLTTCDRFNEKRQLVLKCVNNV